MAVLMQTTTQSREKLDGLPGVDNCLVYLSFLCYLQSHLCKILVALVTLCHFESLESTRLPRGASDVFGTLSTQVQTALLLGQLQSHSCHMSKYQTQSANLLNM